MRPRHFFMNELRDDRLVDGRPIIFVGDAKHVLGELQSDESDTSRRSHCSAPSRSARI